MCSHISLDTHKILSGISPHFAGEKCEVQGGQQLAQCHTAQAFWLQSRCPSLLLPRPMRGIEALALAT